MSQSKEYKRQFMREYRKKNPEKMKAIDLKKRFGISLEHYYEMLEKQNHICAICKRPENAVDHRTGLPRALAVDHCHATGKVRGLLCTQCNRGLGKFNDNKEYLLSAVKYLEDSTDSKK
jgi:hypothetical protein